MVNPEEDDLYEIVDLVDDEVEEGMDDFGEEYVDEDEEEQYIDGGYIDDDVEDQVEQFYQEEDDAIDDEVDLDQIENEIYGTAHSDSAENDIDEEEEPAPEALDYELENVISSKSSEQSSTSGNDYNIEGLDIEMVNPVVDLVDEQVDELPSGGEVTENYDEEYAEAATHQQQYEEQGEGEVDEFYEQVDDSAYVDQIENEICGTVHEIVGNNVGVEPAEPQYPRYARSKMEIRHPKFSGLNNMQIVQRMVQKAKVVNPAEDDEEEDMYFTTEEEYALAKRGIRIMQSKRNLDHRNGNDILVTRENVRFLYLGGGVPLEPVLAHPKLNSIVENFRKELSQRRKLYGDKVKYKVDPSSIVPASVSGSAGSSSIGSEETDPECLATDDESEGEIINGSIAAWLVPDNSGSRSPTPEFELEEPEFILTTGGSHSMEPPTKKRKQKHEPQPHTDGRIYPKPGFSYSCLIAMSLKNSKTGCLPVSEIYKFMCDHFPYFKTAPSGWKNSVRHNLSLNKCFEKIEKPGNGARKGCLWALNPAKIHKMDEEVQKWSRKDPLSIRRAMSDPENLELLERGELKKDYSGNGSDEDEEDEYGEATTTTILTHAQRPADQKIHLKKEDPLDFGTITNVQGNYLCATQPQTYTLSFSNLATTTPIIIRRTPVK